MITETTQYAELCYSKVINDIDTLEKNVKGYPSSSLARFLLLYHYKKNGHPGFEKLASQTGAYLNNPYWIQYQLSQADSLTEREIVNKEIENISIITNQPIVTDEVKNDSLNKENEELTSEPNNEENISTITNQPILTDEVENDSPKTENEENVSETNNEENISTITNQPIVTGNVENESPDTENEDLTSEANNEENVSTITNQPIVTDEGENNSPDTENEEHTSEANNEESVSTTTNQPIVTGNVENDSPKTENEEHTPEANNEENVSTITNPSIATDEGENNSPNTENEESIFEVTNEVNTSNTTNQPGITDEVENAFAKNVDNDQDQTVKEEDAITAIQPAKDTVDNDSSEEEQIAFEPLHTVDYFASQGIKITREELEKDHLGMQVKSFTAWLKSMKKLHPGQVPEQNEVIEKIIQTSSEISNQSANVLTEAMAEVLVKQDKTEKAIEMYQKLSLINPSKSAYFAAKIESLKLT